MNGTISNTGFFKPSAEIKDILLSGKTREICRNSMISDCFLAIEQSKWTFSVKNLSIKKNKKKMKHSQRSRDTCLSPKTKFVQTRREAKILGSLNYIGFLLQPDVSPCHENTIFWESVSKLWFLIEWHLTMTYQGAPDPFLHSFYCLVTNCELKININLQILTKDKFWVKYQINDRAIYLHWMTLKYWSLHIRS